MPLPAEPCHILRLVRRKDSSAEVIHSHLGGNGCGGAVTVAGEHDGIGDPQSTEGGQNFLRLLPQRVGDADHSGQLPPYCQIQVGILRRQGVKALLFAFRNDAALILKDKVGAADEDPLPIYGAGDAVGHQIFHLGVVLLVTQAPALRLLHHGVGHGMGKVFLQAGGQPQHFGFLLGAERYHLSHPGAGMSQGAGLVKDDGVGGSHRLQELAALDGDMGPSRLPHGREDGQRHSQFQGAGEVHHQHRQSPCYIPGKDEAHQTPYKGIGHQLVRQIGSLALSLRLHLLRLLNHVNDLVIAALTGGLLYLQHTLALLHHGAGIDCASGALGYRDGFAGEGRLIDSDLPLQHQAVHGDDAAGADDYRIPRLDLGHRDQHFALGRAQPDPVHIQRHTPGQIRHRFLPCPLLQ